MFVKLKNILFVCLFFCFGIILFILASRLSLGFDEAYNLNLAKTLAQDSRYATRLKNGYRHFDPAVSTGPSLLFPLALAMRVGGANLVTVRATMICIFLFCLAIVYFAAREIFDKSVAIIFLVIFFTTPFVLLWGLSAQGDILAISLTLASLALLNRGTQALTFRNRGQLLLISGLILGLAILTKDIAILFLLAFVASWIIEILTIDQRSWGRLFIDLIPAIVAGAMALIWRGIQFLLMRMLASELTFITWMQIVQSRATLMREVVIFAPFSNSLSAWHSSLRDYGPLIAGILIATIGFVILNKVSLLPKELDLKRFSHKVLVLNVIFWFGWYYLLSGPQANNRHNLNGYVFGELLVVSIAVSLWRLGKNTVTVLQPKYVLLRSPTQLGRILTFGLALTMLLTAWYGVKVGMDTIIIGHNRLVDQMYISAWLKQNTPHDSSLSGAGWFVPWDIAYLTDRTPSEANLYSNDLNGLTNWFILIPEVKLTGNLDTTVQQFLASQDLPVLKRDGYQIYHVKTP